MTPVLDSVDAISCTCEKVLSEMTSEPITGEHYNILEVRSMNSLRKALRIMKRLFTLSWRERLKAKECFLYTLN